jgi:hypothetical protein
MYDLLKDSKVHEGFNLVKSYISKQNYNIMWEEDKQGVDEHRQFVIDNLNDLDIRSIVEEILQGILLGYSVQEILYKVEDGKVLIDNIVPIPRITLNSKLSNFVFDDYDTLIGFRQDTQINSQDENEYIPLDKVIYFAYDSVDGNYMGNPIIKPVADQLRLRKQVINNIKLIVWRYSVPIIAMGLDKDFEDIGAVQKQLGDILDGKSPGLIMDSENTAEILVDKNNHAYLVDLLNYLDNSILSILFNADQKSNGKDTSSSIQVQRESTYNNYNHLINKLNRIFNDLIKRLLDYNFNDVEVYPIFSFDSVKVNNIEKLIYMLGTLDIDKDTETFREIVEESIYDFSSVYPNIDDIKFVKEEPQGGDPFGVNENRDQAKVGKGKETNDIT